MYQSIKDIYLDKIVCIKKIDTYQFIPLDPANTDYQQYLEWVSQGNTPLPPDPEPEPESLTPQQKLEAAGLTVEELKELLGL
jgi:hypothetical protein